MESFFSSDRAQGPSHFISFAFCFALSLFLARFLLDQLFFRGLATWLLRKGTTPLKLNDDKIIIKCCESMWKLTYYASVEAFILQIAYQEPWFTDTKQYFRGWPNQELKLPLKLYYVCQCGFYLYSIVALLTWETRRKDFVVTMSHHVITVILICYSYMTGFFRIGAVVLALHDGCDVFMEAAKILHYSEKNLASSVSFGLFAVSWFVLRLIIFPFWVIKASSYDVFEHLNVSDPYEKSLYYVFNTMLLTLLVFHVYWWILICSMVLGMVKNGGELGEDVREID